MNSIKALFQKIKKMMNRTVVTVMIVVLLLILFIFWGWFVKQYNKVWGVWYVHKGDKAYKSQKLQDAIEYYRKGLELYPEHSSARCNLGNIYVMYEDYFSAVDEYALALKYNPKFTVCRMNLGIVLSEKITDYDGAIQEYKTIINTRKPLWWIPFVFSNVKSTKENKGIAYYNMGLAYRGKSMLMGERSFIAEEYLRKASDKYKEAIRILNRDYDAHYNYALTNHLLGEYKKAGIEYCRAIELAPMNFEAHYNLALLLRHLKMYKESLIELEKAGLIVDTKGDAVKKRYIYDALNEVSQRIIVKGDYEYLKDTKDPERPSNQGYIEYKDGKVVVSEALDKAVLKNMRTCSSKKYFEGL